MSLFVINFKHVCGLPIEFSTVQWQQNISSVPYKCHFQPQGTHLR